MRSWSDAGIPQLDPAPGAVRVFDTASDDVVDTIPQQAESGQRFAMYVCGITPYDATHLGHAATYLTFDLLQRQWRDTGAAVDYVQNVTDIDDPLLERAAQTGQDWTELAQDQTDLFRSDMAALSVIPPAHFIGAVETIPRIASAVRALLDAGFAYRLAGENGEPDGDVYFDTRAATGVGAQTGDDDGWHIGALGRLDRAELLELFAERGGDPDRPGKKDPLDALLWRAAREGEPSWDGGDPHDGGLGAGRPGWHIECTVIADEYLGTPFSVQGGGADLIFPHHDFGDGHNRALTGTHLADAYVHTALVGLDGHKMSKSRGNLVFISRLLESGVDPSAIRALVYGQHYREPWFYTDELLDEATERLSNWREALGRTSPEADDHLVTALRGALRNDLNSPTALAALDEWAKSAGGDEPSDTANSLPARAVGALLGIDLARDPKTA